MAESDSDDFGSAHSDESATDDGGENGYSPEPGKPKVLVTQEQP